MLFSFRRVAAADHAFFGESAAVQGIAQHLSLFGLRKFLVTNSESDILCHSSGLISGSTNLATRRKLVRAKFKMDRSIRPDVNSANHQLLRVRKSDGAPNIWDFEIGERFRHQALEILRILSI
jgi:hypothetical protein